MRKEWFGLTLIGGVILLWAALGLTFFIDGRGSLRWLGQAGLVWVLVCWSSSGKLGLNRASPETPLYLNLGWANRATLLRGVLIAATAGFLGLPLAGRLAWLPGLLYMAAAILDRVDGFIARRSRQPSLLGAELDTFIDALGLVVAPLLAVSYGKVHWSFLLVSAAFYLFQAGIAWRKRAVLPVYPLPPSAQRRATAGFVMGFLAMVLLPPFQPPLTQWLGMCFMLPMLVGFAVDWCVVSGRLATGPSGHVPGFARFERARDLLLLPLLRLGLCFGLCWLFSTGLPGWLGIGLGLFGFMATVGAGARVGALGVLTLLAWHLGAQPLPELLMVILVCAVSVLLFGSGQWSLSRRDSDWVARHDGA